MSFTQVDLYASLEAMGVDALDRLDYGVIRLDAENTVTAYNAAESALSGLSPDRVIGTDFFRETAPCMNNPMVAERFDGEGDLDERLDYVLTLRMKPTPVRLRLLRRHGGENRYLLVRRR